MAQSKDTAIKVESVDKTFILPHEKNNSLKSAIVNPSKKRSYETQQALKNINLEVKKGEFFGVVGKNGSGKSTLLKLIAGIYTPDKGTILVNGKLTPFIELGVGFSPELSGRDNVFLNGSLLGYNRAEMMDLYDEIVEFAELEKFMDQKLKNYSSGMQVRLAFSIAIKIASGILLLDEVLAVGDESFQRKCFSYFHQIKKENRTVVLVSHDMNAIREFCDRAALIDNSKIMAIGKPKMIAEEYGKINSTNVDTGSSDEKRWGNGDANIIGVTTSIKGKKSKKFSPSQKIEVLIEAKVKRSLSNPTIGILIADLAGRPIYATNTKEKGIKLGEITSGKRIAVTFTFENILNDGEYLISCAVNSEDRGTTYSRVEEIEKFSVYGRTFPHSIAHPNYEIATDIS